MASSFDVDSSHTLALNSHFLLDPPRKEAVEELYSPVSDGDTASQRSISLSSPRSSVGIALSPEDEHSGITPVTLVRQNLSLTKRTTIDTDISSDIDQDDRSFFTRRMDEGESPISSIAPSFSEQDKFVASPIPVVPAVMHQSSLPPIRAPALPARPPLPVHISSSSVGAKSETESIASSASGSGSYQKKARPESLLIHLTNGPLVLGIAVVDFDHLIGPKVEFSRGSIFDDEEIAKILPFLALPDGAHLSTEDYSYFHLVPSSPKPSTIFGISCNRQIQTSELLVKEADVTRSTVQKAVVVLASKPVFGLIRDRLGVITRALFAQRDFSDMSILEEFHTSLENSLRSQLTESGLYMGTNLRELVHTFRQRTLVLIKALMLQKKIMFFGHPVERLCTSQYSLATLVPGLLQNLDDCGSPPLAHRAQTLSRPTSLRTSDTKSMMAYVGLPLDLFGKDAFFQPYLPLQQLDMLKETRSWLCGSTNSIVTQQKEIDLLVNIENGTIEFRDPKVERVAGLTAADRKWMDEIVRDVNETYDDDPSKPSTMHFKGSDDYLRQKFEEYMCGALASVKYADFMSKGLNNGVMITDGSGDPNASQDFNALWIYEFKKTNAYEVWDRVTDPLLFDIVEARHPCGTKPSTVSDLGLRLSEGIQELKLDQQLAPTRDAISRTFSAGSTNLFKAMEGVRGRWLQRNGSALSSDQEGSPSASNPASPSASNTSFVEMIKPTVSVHSSPKILAVDEPRRSSESTRVQANGLRPLSMATSHPVQMQQPEPQSSRFSGWMGSLFPPRVARNSSSPSSSLRRDSTTSITASISPTPPPFDLRQSVSAQSTHTASKIEGEEELQVRNLDELYRAGNRPQDDDEDEAQPAGTGVAL